MYITTTTDGTSVRIVPHGTIDYATLPALRAALNELSPAVRDVTWDLHDAVFMDVAGLHLLSETPPHAPYPERQRTVAVAGLASQPLRLLKLAAELFPTRAFACLLPADAPPDPVP
ncbi:STAS domain-containing protein [Streptomyces sp. NPDC056296]|uniref:STAS domain-containing protein n=1 Tax=Streptomyces sp. NPDC056296 TaxID=3345775 RepID=UPI0035E2EE96